MSLLHGRTLALISLMAMASVALRAGAADDLAKVIARLDASAKTFKSAQADIVWDNVQTKPFEDKDSQVGTVLFERGKDGELKLALHVVTDQGRPADKEVVYSDGVGKMYQPGIKQLEVFKVGDNRAQLNTFLTLGFGGSGQDLEKNWKIAYAGVEQAAGGSAVKLQLTPVDASLAKTTPKVLLWIDMDKGVAVKQQRFGSDGGYVEFTYTNIRLNGKAPHDAFEIKTAPGTQIVNH